MTHPPIVIREATRADVTRLVEMNRDAYPIMAEEGVTLEDLLSGLDEAREAAFRETYGRSSTD